MQKRFLYGLIAIVSLSSSVSMIGSSHVYSVDDYRYFNKKSLEEQMGRIDYVHEKLNGILSKFDSSGRYQGQNNVPVSVQLEYQKSLNEMSFLLDHMDYEKASVENASFDDDVDLYSEWFDTYSAWHSYVVQDQDTLAYRGCLSDEHCLAYPVVPEGAGDEKSQKESSSGAKDVGTDSGDDEQGLDGLIEDDKADGQRKQIMQQIVANVFLAARRDLYTIVSQFSGKVALYFVHLGAYSQENEHKLDQFLADSLQSSMHQVDDVSKIGMRVYYSELEKHDIATTAGSVTDPFAKKLREDINDIEYSAIGEMRGLIEILKMKTVLPAIGADIATQNNVYKQVAAEQFQKAQADASREREATWWDDLKASGAEFAHDFAVNFEKEFDKALDKAFEEAMGEIGEHVTGGLSSFGGKVGESIGNQVRKVVGNQAVDKLKAMTADKAGELLDKVPDLLKKQTLRRLGIDENEELGVAALKAVIRNMNEPGHDFKGLTVRQSAGLSAQERRFVDNRMPKIQEALNHSFGITSPLKIGLCSSGGGNRAMLASLGFFLGAEEIGLFNASLYNAALSGSTWTVSPWSYFNATQDMTLSAFKDQLVGRLDDSMVGVAGVAGPPMLGSDVLQSFGMNIAKRFAYNQQITTIDAYGALIGNYTLMPAGGNRLNVTWSSIASKIEEGNIPYPIGSAVSLKGKKTGENSEYYWYEIGPFEAGSDPIGYVPTWAFGSKFDQGRPEETPDGAAPEYPLSYFEGVYGSAFAASGNEVLDQAIPKPSFSVLGKTFTLPIDVWIEKSLASKAKDARLYPASFYNFTKNLIGSPIKNKDQIELYDGAMNFNFPLPLLLRPSRNLDVVVICDASIDADSLKRAAKHFERNNIKFPSVKNLTKANLMKNHMTVFNDPRGSSYDADMITILYFPLMKNDSFDDSFDPTTCASSGPCRTFNFKYTKEEAEKVVGLAQANVLSMKDEVKQVLQSLANHKA